jgi:hypothetical protein
MTAGARVYDKKLKKVGAIQSVSYYDPVTYYQRLYGSWPIRNFDQITVRFDGDGSDTIYRGEPCGTLELESATTGSAYSKLVLWHDFEETAGTVIGDWKDNVHSVNEPTATPATKSTSSAVGDRCLVFNGTNQYTLGGVTNMPTTKMSFAFWIKTTDTAGTLVSFGGGASNNVERAVKLSAGKVQLFEKNGGAETSLLSSGTVNDDSWHHIVCTIAGISSVWKIYVDQVDVSASVVNGPGNTNLAVTQTTIAVSYLNAAISNYYAGSMDDLRIYNDVLTTAEITELYVLKPVFAGTQSSAYSSLVSWYRMEEATEPTVFVDSKGSNDMTVYNTSWYSLPADGVDQGTRCFKPNRPASSSSGYNSTEPIYGYSKIALSGSGIDYNTFSVSFWFKTTTTQYHSTLWSFNSVNGSTTAQTFMGCRYSKSNGGYFNYMVRWRPTFNDTTVTDQANTVQGEANYHDNDWHHIVCTKSGATASDNMKIYVNGSLKTTSTLTNTGGKDFSEIDNFTVGVANYRPASGSTDWIWWAKDVSMDDFRLYDAEISATAVSELYATK